ncbi:hypothetical protein JB92DRAFT_3123112 [Gautieria morchelliformis]|nr:hypothetical protein JB92DRAFT_3123112 [Gautieria morchelliformis]
MTILMKNLSAGLRKAGKSSESHFWQLNRSISSIGMGTKSLVDRHLEWDQLDSLSMGGKDEWSSYLIKLVVMPNVRLARAIAHVKLDVIEEIDYRIAITDVRDMGTETGLSTFQTSDF